MTGWLADLGLVSEEDYLEGEIDALEKHEYLGGFVYAMAGARSAHNAIATNALVSLGSQLRGKPCRPFNSDTKVRVQLPTHVRYYYPDGMIVCDQGPEDATFQQAPVILVEVISASTRRTDEQEKREAYLSIPTLQVYLLFESEIVSAKVWRRDGSGFTAEKYVGREAVIPLPEIGGALALAEVYEAVKLTLSSADVAAGERY